MSNDNSYQLFCMSLLSKGLNRTWDKTDKLQPIGMKLEVVVMKCKNQFCVQLQIIV